MNKKIFILETSKTTQSLLKKKAELPDDKAANLMLERCIEFEKNPPENWDGAITFHKNRS